MERVVFLDSLFEQYVAVAVWSLIKFVEAQRFNQLAKLYALCVVLQVSLRVPLFRAEVFVCHDTPLCRQSELNT